MLTVELFGPGGENAAVIEATRILVKDKFGNPLILAVEYDDDGGRSAVLAAHLDDPDFETLLSTLCLTKSVVLNRIDASRR